MAADPSEIVSGDVPGDGDILMRLMRTRATLPESSPQDRACRDAALSIETLRSENALLREVVVDLWDHMDDQACIEFSASRPRSYLVADQEWQNERARSEPAASSTSEEAGHGG